MVHVDAGNRLWLSVEGFGLYRMNAARTGFIAVPLLDGLQPVLDIWAIASDKDGSIWVGTFGSGLFRELQPGGRCGSSNQKPVVGSPDENVLALAQDAEGTLWIATSSGIVLWRNGRFQAFDNDLLVSKVVINLLPDANAATVAGDAGRLQRVTPEGKLETPRGLANELTMQASWACCMKVTARLCSLPAKA